MINVSNEFKAVIAESGRKQYAYVDVELADNAILNLRNKDISENGLEIKDGTSASNSFQVGTAIINEATVLIDNLDGRLSDIDFTDAVIRPAVGLQLGEGIALVKKGVFTVDQADAIGDIIQLIARDNMHKFDTPFSDVFISFPCFAYELLEAISYHCQVSTIAWQWLNYDYIIDRRPEDEAVTCREMLSYIAQVSANNARFNNDGALELKWYDIAAFEETAQIDGGIFDEDTPYSSGDNVDGGDFTFSESTDYDGGDFAQLDRFHHIYAMGSSTIATDDVVITGVRVKAMGTESDYGETVLFGTEGYVIEIEKNPLITEGKASLIANSVGAKIVGMRFRPCSLTAWSDPSREAGDVAKVSDRKGNVYNILLTNVDYNIGELQPISCDAESPSKNKAVQYTEAAKAVVEARRNIEAKLSTYDLAMQQMNNLISNGFGMYPTEEIQPDGSTIYYMHDKPTIAESGSVWKFTSGGLMLSNDHGITWGVDKNGNMLVRVLTAIGINAEWIKVITNFTVGNNFKVNALGELISGKALFNGSVVVQPSVGTNDSSSFILKSTTQHIDFRSNAIYFQDALPSANAQTNYQARRIHFGLVGSASRLHLAASNQTNKVYISAGDDFANITFNDKNQNYSELSATGLRTTEVSCERVSSSNMARGIVSISPYVNSPTEVAIVFNNTFTFAPSIVATANSTVPGEAVKEVSYARPTTTGCSILVYRANDTTTVVSWIAMN